MDERAHAAYMADLDYFQSQLESTKNANLYLPIATISTHLNHYDDAIAVAQEGLKAIPSYTQLQVVLAEAFLNTGRRDEAKELLHDAILVDSNNYKALKLLGMIYRSEDYRTEALRYLRTAYLLAPEDPEIYGWLEEIGGFPLSGTSEQIKEEDADFGNFDNDLVFEFNVDKVVNESKAAMDAMIEEITGKPSSTATPTSAEEALTTVPEPAKVEEASNDISDDEIAAALSKAAAPAVATEPAKAEETSNDISDDEIAAALSKAAAPAVATEPAKAEETSNDISDDEIAAALSKAAAPAVAAPEPAKAEETSNDISDDEIAAALSKAAAPAVSEAEPIEDAAPELPAITPEPQDATINELPTIETNENIETADDDLPDLLSIEEVLPVPADLVASSAIPELAELPDPAADIDEIDEDELQKALDSFNKLPMEAPLAAEVEDDRLEPIIPKGLVDEVLQESGLDTEHPYDDDEPIDSLIHDKNSKPAEESAELAPVEEVDEEPLPSLDDLMSVFDDPSTAIEPAGFANDATPSDDAIHTDLAPLSTDLAPIDLTSLTDLTPFDSSEQMLSMDDETVNLWELEEKIEPEVVPLWADSNEEDREETIEEKDEKEEK